MPFIYHGWPWLLPSLAAANNCLLLLDTSTHLDTSTQLQTHHSIEVPPVLLSEELTSCGKIIRLMKLNQLSSSVPLILSAVEAADAWVSLHPPTWSICHPHCQQKRYCLVYHFRLSSIGSSIIRFRSDYADKNPPSPIAVADNSHCIVDVFA